MPSNPPALAGARHELQRLAQESIAAREAYQANLTWSDETAACHTAHIDAMERLREACTEEVILALCAALEAGEADTRDAERYRFLRDNPLQLRAVDGNAGFPRPTTTLDYHVDLAMDDARSAAAIPATPEPATDAE